MKEQALLLQYVGKFRVTPLAAGVAGLVFAVADDEADLGLAILGHRDDGGGEQPFAGKVRAPSLARVHELGEIENRKFALVDSLGRVVRGKEHAVCGRADRQPQLLLHFLGAGGVTSGVDQLELQSRRHAFVLSEQIFDRLEQVCLPVEQHHGAHVVGQCAKYIFRERRQAVVSRLREDDSRGVSQREQIGQQDAHCGHHRREDHAPRNHAPYGRRKTGELLLAAHSLFPAAALDHLVREVKE